MYVVTKIFFSTILFSQLLKVAKLQDNDADVRILSNEILRWTEIGYEGEFFSEYVRKLGLSGESRNVDFRSFKGDRANMVCTLCKSLTTTVISMRRNGTSEENLTDLVTKFCTRLNIQKEHICRGVISLNMPILVYIIDARPNLNPTDVCGLVLQNKFCTTISDEYEWSLQIDENPPKVINPPKIDGTMKILQLTDFHYDPLYEPNGNPYCDEPVCCRKGQNATNVSGKVSGYWGDYNECDTPWHVVEDTLDHINSTHRNIEAVYFTGDLVDHGVWETSKDRNFESIAKSYKKIKETFMDVPVYPIIGNHEPHPLNVFAPSFIKDEKFSTEWLYKISADLWIEYGWLPESTRKTILRGGFYTVSLKKGYRIIAVNNNVCYTYNWWLILEPQDPDGQLRWLAETLLEAESNGEFVHLLAHIPPGHRDCYKSWSKEYRKILNRFAHIISGEFNGHTHQDELKIYYDQEDPSEASNIAWNGGSLTTFSYFNPNYKMYTINSTNLSIVDVDTWIFNLTAANETPEKRPDWYKSYSFREEYELPNLSPATLHKWVQQMSNDKKLFEKYRSNYHKRAEPKLKLSCDDACMSEILCDIVTTSSDDTTRCNDISFFNET